MSRGYADGPATEERQAALESAEPEPVRAAIRQAVYGSTDDKPEKHFIGWLGDVDPDQLFDSGRAWGISIVRKSE
jgi:hypothetical protein